MLFASSLHTGTRDLALRGMTFFVVFLIVRKANHRAICTIRVSLTSYLLPPRSLSTGDRLERHYHYLESKLDLRVKQQHLETAATRLPICAKIRTRFYIKLTQTILYAYYEHRLSTLYE
jgi:hypothetical protein